VADGANKKIEQPMTLKLFDLTDRLALITGSSRGIGLGLAKGLAEAGAEVVLNGRDADKLAAAAANLKACGHKVHEAAFDVTSQTAVAEAIDTIEKNVAQSAFSSTTPECSFEHHLRTIRQISFGSCCVSMSRACFWLVKPWPAT
jgi:NAD(P)-dependent dehydrogenase (short-subunit alcohol dehydrogenase family)